MEEKLETYYFTFGVGQKYEGKFVKITAESYMDARAKMVDRFGTKWAFQYSEDEWVNENGITQQDEFNLIELK
jgi:hypothetical protein